MKYVYVNTRKYGGKYMYSARGTRLTAQGLGNLSGLMVGTRVEGVKFRTSSFETGSQSP